jgi:hypothetical protein
VDKYINTRIYLNYSKLISIHFRLADVSGHAASIFRVLRKIVHIARKNMAFPFFRRFERACSDQTDFCKAYSNTGIDTASISYVCKKGRSTNIFERDILLAFLRISYQMLTERGCNSDRLYGVYIHGSFVCIPGMFSAERYVTKATGKRLPPLVYLLHMLSKVSSLSELKVTMQAAVQAM